VAELTRTVENLSTADEPPPSPPPANAAPVADQQQLAVAHGEAFDITLTASAGENDSLTYTISGSPPTGSLASRLLTSPIPRTSHFSGDDNFTFQVNDGKADSNVAEISIYALPYNQAPQAFDQPADAQVNTAADIGLSAEDPDGDPLVYTIVQQPAYGPLSDSATTISRMVTYTPQQDYSGLNSFAFQANDGQLDSNVATVSSTVDPGQLVNVVAPAAAASAPGEGTAVGAHAVRKLAMVANDRTLVRQMNAPAEVTLTVSDNEHDALAFMLVTQTCGWPACRQPVQSDLRSASGL
jgi:hypothetical protein